MSDAADSTDDGFVTHQITLTVDGEQIPVQLEEPGMMTKTELARKAPSPVAIQMGAASADAQAMIKRSVDTVSDFPPELLDELPQEQFTQLIESVNTVLRGEEPTIDNRDPKSASDSYRDIDDDAFGDDASQFF